MNTQLFVFPITDFEEVYSIIDNDKQRLHISPVNYSFNITLDLTRDLSEQIEQNTKFGEINFNKRLLQAVEKIVQEVIQVESVDPTQIDLKHPNYKYKE